MIITAISSLFGYCFTFPGFPMWLIPHSMDWNVERKEHCNDSGHIEDVAGARAIRHSED